MTKRPLASITRVYRAFRVGDVSDRRDPVAFDCHVGVVNLGGRHVDEPPSLDDNVSWGFTHCNVDECSSLHIAFLGPAEAATF